MGLDMFMFKRRADATPFYDEENETEDYDWSEVAYWRKANEIHKWFVDYLNLYEEDFNCEYAEIDKNGLQELVDTCKFVLGRKNKNDGVRIAEQYLPTQGGFFFGSLDYDEYYYSDLENTVSQLEKIIKETDWDNEIVAYYCWW